MLNGKSTSRRPRLRASANGDASHSRADDILACATAIFARQGYRSTDVQEIADALGVGKGTIYRSFASKRELFLAAADRGMRLLNDEIEGSLQTVRDPLEQIANAIATYLSFFQRHPEFAELLIQERAEFRDRTTPTYFAHRAANIDRWRNRYRLLIRQKRLRTMPVDHILNVVSGLVYGTMFINFFTGRKRSSAAQARQIIDVVFNGLLTPDERARRKRKDV